MTKYLNAAKFEKYTPEHDNILKTALEPVLGVFELYELEGYPVSVKVPESFTFEKFESGWDQDDYIHNDNAFEVADYYGLEYKVLQDYPRYSPGHCQNSLRFFFKNVKDAEKFIIGIEVAILNKKAHTLI